MKKLLTLLFSAVLAISAIATPWDGTAAASFAGGTGTSGDPYQIATAEQLAYLVTLANTTQTSNVNTTGIYYKLTADIDLNGPTKSWTPIGTSTITAFAGVFDGDNHLINNIYINNTASGNPQGLFGYVVGTVSANVIIKNITIASGSVTTSYATGTTYTSALAGRCVYTQLSNCKNTINVTGYTNAGGIVGRIDGVSTIDGCSNVGTVKSTQNSSPYTGGIVGLFTGLITNGVSDVSYIRSCYNRGAITSPNDVGGIAGSATGNISIDKCFNTGTINGTVNGASGGIVGYGYNTGTNQVAVLNISNCYNTGAIKALTTTGANYCAGGILGYVGSVNTRYFGTILNCYNTGTITGYIKEPIAAQLVGLSGTYTGGTVTNSYFLAGSGTNGITSDGTSVADAPTLQTYATTLNNSQTPTVWQSDLTPNRNGGYPILSWVTSFTKLTAPTVQTPTAITTTGFTANWTTVANAIGYYVNVYTNASPSVYKTSLYTAGQATTSTSITGLTANTSYIVTVVSVAPSGTTFIDSEESAFAIAGISGATVLLSSFSQASSSSATVNCSVTDGAGTGVTVRGICFASSTGNPTTSNTTVIDPGTGNGSYSATMSSLLPNTTYYFRAYAINNNRTNYSIVSSFKILPAPDVSTGASGITASGFTANWAAVGNASSYDVMVFDNTSAQVGLTVNVIAGTLNLLVSGLSANSNYTYTVTAKGDNVSYFNSAGSSAVPVTTTLGTGLNNTATGVSIRVEDKQVICSETGEISIYNLQGAQLIQAKGVNRVNTKLSRGIYLVRFSNADEKQTIQKVTIQ